MKGEGAWLTGKLWYHVEKKVTHFICSEAVNETPREMLGEEVTELEMKMFSILFADCSPCCW